MLSKHFFLVTASMVFVILVCNNPAIGQQKKNSFANNYRFKTYATAPTSPKKAMKGILSELNLEEDAFRPERISTSSNGIHHAKYQQYYLGIPIFACKYILHSENEKMISSNGNIARIDEINTTPNIDISAAERIAKKELPSEKYFDDRVEPIELMIIDKAFPAVSEQYSLVYKVEVYAKSPMAKKIFFVDAHTGSIILDLPGLAHESTPAIAHTKYYGEQEIITEATSDGQYILQDLTRGDGITTLNNDLTPFVNNSTEWDLTNSNQNEVALDAHYATEKFYDLMLQQFNWDGLDGEGLSMNPVVHANGGLNLVNAYWDGNNAWFGNGDCHRGPLTTLEVVAHEFMHGITDYTSDLIYSYESGAINESMSDIFGKALEYYYDPDNFNWSIGESFLLTDFIEPFRYMDDPNRKNMPAYYKGNFWRDGGSVHQHSAIGNLWFHILVEGKSDTTEIGEPFEVSGIGMDKALEIVWQVQSNYLTPNATYHDMYLSSLDVTTAIYGEESPELRDVTEAWKAVGLPQTTEGSSALNKDVAVQIEFIPQRQCRRNEYLPFTVTLVNFGTEDIPANSGILLYVDNAENEATEIEIIQSIEAGASLSIDFDSLYYLVEPGTQYISAYAVYEEDENFSNNNYNLRPYRIDNFDPTYNSLDYGLINIQTPCFTDSINFAVFIENLSCNTIEAGSTIKYIIQDDEFVMIKQNEIILENDLLSGEKLSVIDFILGSYDIINIEAYTEINPAIDILPKPYSVDFRRELVGEYFNDLSDINRNDEELEIFKVNNLVTFQDNLYIAKSGGTQEELFYPCPDQADDFQSVSGYHNGYGSVSACVDLTGNENPILSFDLIQLRDDSDILPEFENLRTRAKISWGDEDDEHIIIEGLEEGIEENISIPLAPNFKGAFSLEFVHLTGTWYNENNPDLYFGFDVNMLRNLEIKNVNNTYDAIAAEDIFISPNPGNGTYHLNSPYEIKKIDVINLHGKIISTSTNERNILNIQSAENGYYILRLYLKDGRQINKSIININN